MSPSFVPNSLTLPPITSNPTLLWFYSIVCPPKNSCKRPNNYFLSLFPMISNYLYVHCFSCSVWVMSSTLWLVCSGLWRDVWMSPWWLRTTARPFEKGDGARGLRYTPGNIDLSALFGREQKVNKGAHTRIRFFGFVKPWKANLTRDFKKNKPWLGSPSLPFRWKFGQPSVLENPPVSPSC